MEWALRHVAMASSPRQQRREEWDVLSPDSAIATPPVEAAKDLRTLATCVWSD